MPSYKSNRARKLDKIRKSLAKKPKKTKVVEAVAVEAAPVKKKEYIKPATVEKPIGPPDRDVPPEYRE